MPRTLPEEWTQYEIEEGGREDIRPSGYLRAFVTDKMSARARLLVLRRSVARQFHDRLQADMEPCPYCKWQGPHRGKIRRINLHEQFTHLTQEWKEQTRHISNMTTRAMYPAYQRIIGMGRSAVPFILEELRKGELDDWFWALYAITGENPITEDIAGDIEKMAEAWLRWGRDAGYLSDSIQQMK